jgi:TolB-like protein/Tfp pilus assembly protein PilF
MSKDRSKLQTWFAELRRRKVIRVAAVYLVAAWLLIQVADAIFEPIGLPAWSLKLVIVLVALGFPLACVLAWAFDVTPRGIERAETGVQPTSAASAAGRASLPPPEAPPVEVPAAAAAPTESVAILPFVDMSPERDQEYFCDGIAEEIINALCCMRNLRVASRTSSFQFKGHAADVREIGRTLGVGSVLEGSVRKAGNRVRITTQLVGTADGYHLWSESFDRDLADVFALQAEIAQHMLKALKLSIDRRETAMLGRVGTRNAEAYDLYLRGRSHMRYGTSSRRAMELLRRALERDPTFAQAHAEIASAIAVRGLWRLDVTPAEIEEAMEASRRALELEPLLPEAHVARACLLSMEGKAEAAAQDFEQAIRLNPTAYYTYYLYARHLFAMGRIDQSVRMYEEADRLQPGEYQVLCMFYGALRKKGDTAAEQAVAVRAMDAIDRQLRLDPEDARALQLGAVTAANIGRRERALALAERALRARPDEFSTTYNLACAYAELGERDKALDMLERAARQGGGNLGWIRQDPDFDSLRDDPRFVRLVSIMSADRAQAAP